MRSQTSFGQPDRSSDRYLLEWGTHGVRTLARGCEVIVLVDVLWFTTVVSLIVETDAVATLTRRHDPSATSGGGALQETATATTLFELALGASADQRVEIPDPNHAALAHAAAEYGAQHVLAGCLRNARATATLADRLAGPRATVGIVVVGERWRSTTGPLRPCVADLLGAGAILSALDPSAAVGGSRCSPEAASARAAFLDARPLITDALMRSTSVRLLQESSPRDHTADVTDLVMLASAVDVTDTAAILVDGEFRAVNG
jgi:2-phosphosulfolactate phosphatase